MKSKLTYFVYVLFLCTLISETLFAQGNQIVLDASQIEIVFPQSNVKNYEALVDEQEKYPNEGRFKITLEDGTTDTLKTVPYTEWITGWEPGIHEVIIDLGETFSLDQLSIYRIYSSATVSVYTGEAGNWSLLLDDELNGLYSWNNHLCSVNTRYLRFTADVSKTFPAVEIAVFGDVTSTENTPPSAVSDLASEAITSGQVWLSWTVPSADGGQVQSYDLRYSNSPMTLANWSTATQVEVGQPIAPGTEQLSVITGLAAGTTYYFGLKSSDAFGNESDLSNVLNVITAAIDSIAPSGVTDLSVLNIDSSWVELSFTPTGDDDIYDNFDQVILKYFTDTITESNWDIVANEVALPYSNNLSGCMIDQLNEGERYYFAVKVLDEAGNESVISNLVGARTLYQPKKIRLLPEMFTLSKAPHRTATSSIAALADEQTFVGDPLYGEWKEPLTDFIPAWQDQDTYYPVEGYIDLGQPTDISMMYLFDKSMSDTLEVYYGWKNSGDTIINWQLLFIDELRQYNTWSVHNNLNISTQYLKLNFKAIGAHIGEVLLYGYVPEDTIAPLTISDLSLNKLTSVTADISWTAPGDDGIYDKAEAYQIGVSTAVITEANWDNVLLIADVEAPGIPESKESYSFNELTPNTEYYVAIRTIDDNNNLSDISNIISFTTEPEDFIAPSQITNLKVADTSYDAARISWTAGGDDNNSGIADRYEIKYSTAPITDSNWESANATTSYLVPDSTTTFQFITLYGLSSEATYYAAIKVFDEVDNASELSNVVSFTTTAKEVYQQPYVDEYIGCNALINAWLTHMQAFGYIREYHNWHWTDPGVDIAENPVDSGYVGYPDNKLRFNFWYGYWDFDNYYKKLDASDIMVAPCLQHSVPWLPDFTEDNKFRPTLTLQDDSELPESYVAHGDFMFQYVARYGNTKVEDELLKVDEDQERLSGLGHIKYYENWNEPNNWWNSAYGQFSAEQMAAMSSADYDGDLGRIGNTVGVRNADINSKLVLGGLVGLDLDFIKDMKVWSDSARGGSFPCDVINLHHYCNVTHNGQKTMEEGSSPESDSLKYMVREIRDYIDANLPGKEFWITEFGWDTDMSSDQRCEPIKGYSSEEVQAMWLVRAYLEMYAGGVDRAALFTLYDAGDPTSGRFASCGVISNEESGRVPKVGWYFTYALKNILAKTRFVSEHATGNNDILMYEFASDNREKVSYAVWCPTSDSVTVPGYKVSVKDMPLPVALIQLEHGNIHGVKSYPEVINDSITIEVSEVPQFIMFGNEPVDITAPGTIDSISFSFADKTISWLASGDDGFKKMTDHYVLKLDTVPLTEDNWDNLLAFDTIAATVLPTYTENYLLDGIPEDVTYYMGIKAYDEAGNASEISKQLIRMQQIVLDTTMLNILSGGGSGFGLVDEQFEESPVTKWEGNYHDDKHVLVDLESDYVVPVIYFYREYAKESFDVYAGRTEETLELVGTYTFDGSVYGWNEISLNDTVRYMRLECNDDSYFPILELKLFGAIVDTITVEVPAEDIDTIAVNDLTALVSLDETVSLSFTIPQEIADVEYLSGFIVAMSNSPITEENWDQAELTAYNESLNPLGVKEVTVSSLASGVDYYFAIKLLDESGSLSSISNSVTAQVTDNIAPAGITNLSLNRIDNTLLFNWPTAGDNARQGLATSYEIWFSETLITDANLQSAELFATDIMNNDYSDIQQYDAVFDKSVEGFFAVVAVDEAGNKSVISNVITSDMQIILRSEMVTVVNGGAPDEASVMVDEQFVNEPSTKWNGEYFSPKEIIIDLQDTYKITKEIFYRMFSRDDIFVYYGEPGNWTYMYKDDYYKMLTNTYTDTVVTRYIRLDETKKRTYWPLYEIKLYGSRYEVMAETRSVTLEGGSLDERTEMEAEIFSEDMSVNADIKVYSNQQQIIIESDDDALMIEVSSMTGKRVIVEKELGVYKSDKLYKGLYVVRLNYDGIIENRKVLVR